MEKNIVESINVKEVIMEKGLVLNTSYDIFYLGEDISKYEKYVRYKKHYDDPNGFDSYETFKTQVMISPSATGTAEVD